MSCSSELETDRFRTCRFTPLVLCGVGVLFASCSPYANRVDVLPNRPCLREHNARDNPAAYLQGMVNYTAFYRSEGHYYNCKKMVILGMYKPVT